jgi:hypothetical protein
MNRKVIYLFLALMLPGLIFVFLKYFGKNEFDIPVYYENGIAEVPEGCKYSPGPYIVPDSVLTKWNWKGSSLLVALVEEGERKVIKQLITDAKVENLQVVDLDKTDNKIKTCVLLVKDPWDVVLIDNHKRIRGYYKTGHRDDMDRLEVELKILLKKY